jgi:hypothetical protein
MLHSWVNHHVNSVDKSAWVYLMPETGEQACSVNYSDKMFCCLTEKELGFL